MYRILRSLHLCAGLFSLLFLVAYAASSVQMTHRVRLRSRTTQRSVSLTPGLPGARAVAQELARRFQISGELTSVKTTPTGASFRVLRLGKVWSAEYASTTGATRLQITDSGILGAFNRMHQMHGIWHNWVAYNIWVLLLALVSFAILVLGGTGIYLWWKTHRDLRFTGALLIFGMVLSGGLAIWMR
jgi:hypothetical protein